MHPSLTRRRFLTASALLPFAASLAPSSARAAYAAIPRHSGPHLRPSLNVYSFLELLNANAKDKSKGLDLFGGENLTAGSKEAFTDRLQLPAELRLRNPVGFRFGRVVDHPWPKRPQVRDGRRRRVRCSSG